MDLVRDTFDTRLSDIESYFELVNNIEKAIGSGGATLHIDGAPYRISTTQQKIMYSGIYLHLYNLVESTMMLLIEAVERHTSSSIHNNVSLLTEKMKRLYVKSVAEPVDATAVSPEKRLLKYLKLFDQVLGAHPVEIKIPQGGGGNWGVQEIERISDKIGVTLDIDNEIYRLATVPLRDDKGPLRFIKDTRNKLAHGSISFAECGEYHVASDFRHLINVVRDYLMEVINSYQIFIEDNGFRLS
jgi:hypothetical protein